MINNSLIQRFEASDTGYILLLIAVTGDLILPFLLAPFYKEYHHLTMVMSLLGNRKCPVHVLYSIWLLVAGTMFVLGGLKLYLTYLTVSKFFSIAFIICMVLYAVGGCILSGIFPVGDTKKLTTFSEKVHGYGSVLGFVALIFVPLIVGFLFMYSGKTAYGVLSFVFFGLATLFFVLFVMADKDKFSNTWIAYEGLWQRLSLLCMYAPLLIISCIK